MNKPQNYRQKRTDGLEMPRVLAAENYRYHYMDAAGLVQPLVFWSEPYGGTASYEAGTHDGMRDGASGGAPIQGWIRYYANLQDYLEAGNPDPR